MKQILPQLQLNSVQYQKLIKATILPPETKSTLNIIFFIHNNPFFQHTFVIEAKQLKNKPTNNIKKKQPTNIGFAIACHWIENPLCDRNSECIFKITKTSFVTPFSIVKTLAAVFFCSPPISIYLFICWKTVNRLQKQIRYPFYLKCNKIESYYNKLFKSIQFYLFVLFFLSYYISPICVHVRINENVILIYLPKIVQIQSKAHSLCSQIRRKLYGFVEYLKLFVGNW